MSDDSSRESPRSGDVALVLHPHIRGEVQQSRDPAARLAEAVALTAAIDLKVEHHDVVALTKAKPGTLFGEGKLEEIGTFIKSNDIDVVIIDGTVTPVQQRNLERRWQSKVIDRTGLILEIFGDRAQTREGTLQVELAHLSYQRTRLVRSWTHLERQRGALSFVGGPGESQLEIDRRLIDERIGKLKKQLEKVVRTRELHRSKRKKVPYPIVALVGYTNAGKSSLFNRLTKSDVFAKDLLFATLDPTMRKIELPGGQTIILSDTVGFISALPTELVASFRATLEEVLEADLIVHVRDISHPETEAQKRDVINVLANLGIDLAATENHIEVMNKTDLLSVEERQLLQNRIEKDPDSIAMSAISGEGCDQFAALVERKLTAKHQILDIDLKPEDGATLSWIYRNATVLRRSDDEETIHLSLRISADNLGRLRKRQKNL